MYLPTSNIRLLQITHCIVMFIKMDVSISLGFTKASIDFNDNKKNDVFNGLHKSMCFKFTNIRI